LLLNASWLEAFLLLSDMVGGALRTSNNLNQLEARRIRR
jgi:hypothetical protein